ncbi:uncharacterized protein CELE_F46C3.6 [Caenorhabditis elegans]|uniref:Uncharacterized protein n=1 Tax=Caenorhabditis elegans TaxID=6239 RepID=A3FPK5_CAEEL|nr:Uncharacterized protein CELE_F46C3.6 [Caenorhabditis elegans]CAM33503.1 Uncharacterized protein CELE_F46C3.6 [Caenorhabditis elegans]|eukprot:NP_001123144.1 Uncharacterized protein CELE_F46C3.6 [Caenorhabditis elegans]
MNLVFFILIVFIVFNAGVDCRRRRMVIDDVIRQKRAMLFREDMIVKHDNPI